MLRLEVNESRENSDRAVEWRVLCSDCHDVDKIEVLRVYECESKGFTEVGVLLIVMDSVWFLQRVFILLKFFARSAIIENAGTESNRSSYHRWVLSGRGG